MYKWSFATGSFCLFATLGFSQDVAQISETLGHLIGKNLEQFGLDFDLDAIAKGLKDEVEGKDAPMSEEACARAILSLQDEKIADVTDHTLEQADAASNGDQLYEDCSISTPDSAKHG